MYVKSDTQITQTTVLKHAITCYNAICHLLTLLVSRSHHQPAFLKMPSIICLDHQWLKLLDCTAKPDSSETGICYSFTCKKQRNTLLVS